MVAAHAWDLCGAEGLGLRTAYVARPPPRTGSTCTPTARPTNSTMPESVFGGSSAEPEQCSERDRDQGGGPATASRRRAWYGEHHLGQG